MLGLEASSEHNPRTIPFPASMKHVTRHSATINPPLDTCRATGEGDRWGKRYPLVSDDEWLDRIAGGAGRGG